MKDNNPGGALGVVLGTIEEIDRLNQVLAEWVPRAFPVGMTVHWDHGSYVRSGVVDFHSGTTFRASELRVSLQSGGSKWLSVTQLHEFSPDSSLGG